VEQYGDWSDEVGRVRVVVDFQKANWVQVGRVRVVVYFQLGNWVRRPRATCIGAEDGWRLG
jgi:hypothetical protein